MKKQLIYIIDDMKVILKKTAHLLSEYKVITSTNPIDALDEILECKPDLILTDYEMPDFNGLDLCRALKNNPSTADIPIILMTSTDGDKIVNMAYEAGVSEFLNKNYAAEAKIKLRVKNILELKKIADDIKANSKRNEDLLKILTHDLSTPLTIIDGLSKILLGKVEDTKILNSIQKINRVSSDSIEILEEIKNMLRSEDHQISIVPLNVRDLLTQLKAKFEEKFKSKSIEFSVKDAPEDLEIYAEKAILLNNIFYNVLSTSYKFTNEGGKVSIVFDVKKKDVHFYFVDDGVGIPKDILDDIFEKGTHVSRPGTNHEKGTGFGLGIIKTFMDRLEGEITIRSQDIESSPDYHYTEFNLSFKKVI